MVIIENHYLIIVPMILSLFNDKNNQYWVTTLIYRGIEII